MKGFLMFIFLFLAAIQCIIGEANRIDVRKKHENDAASHITTGVWNQEKPKRLFSRTRYLSQQRHHVVRTKPRPEAPSPVQTPARRCGGLMESCSSLTPCCDPCASCHCRLFNTICHCWRLGPFCPKKT
ncbi:agouti-signaling protein 2b [Paramisgurnus dabryanus]|uniref:agouti-signaling protein 2b n=1 Tax=Paramisgurnus dabryanus TaxID=90735 RepID=UPI0031F42065